MTKTANRAAAKAYQAEQRDKLQAEARQRAAAADLAELNRLRRYLIFNKQSAAPADDLVKAIDAFAERITGDPCALYERLHSIGI